MDDNPEPPGQPEQWLVTAAEMRLLKTVRQEKLSRVIVQLRRGRILNIETEQDIPPSELDEQCGSVLIKNIKDFETITLTRHQGRTAKAKRIKPMPLTDQENRRQVIAIVRFEK